jgi:hypothetical protein
MTRVGRKNCDGVIGIGAQIGLRRDDDVLERHCFSPVVSIEGFASFQSYVSRRENSLVIL